MVEAEGRPVRLILKPGQAGDAPVVPELLADLRAGATPIADRAYDTDAIQHSWQSRKPGPTSRPG